MRLLFAGTPEAAIPALDMLIDSHHEIVAVLTRPDAPTGRGRTLRPSPVRARAHHNAIPVLTDRPHGSDFAALLKELAIDAAPVVAYGHILRPEILAIPTHGWINLHLSILPAWRGAAPVQRAIIAGDDITGTTTFQIGPGLDDGPVYGTTTRPIAPHHTAGDLLSALAEDGAHLLLATLNAIEDGTARPQPQPSDPVSHAPKLSTLEAHINWHTPAHIIDRHIRGCTPAPGAWTTLPNGTRLGIGPSTLRPEITDLAPGQLATTKHETLVGTTTCALALGHVTPSGKKPMPAPDWARGAHLTNPTTLGATP